MNITDVRIRKVDKEGKMKAVVSITIDNEFAVHDIKIIEGEKGVFIAMPSRKNAEGEYRDVAHPINSDTRTQLQEMIMEKYREEIAEAQIIVVYYPQLHRRRILHCTGFFLFDLQEIKKK